MNRIGVLAIFVIALMVACAAPAFAGGGAQPPAGIGMAYSLAKASEISAKPCTPKLDGYRWNWDVGNDTTTTVAINVGDSKAQMGLTIPTNKVTCWFIPPVIKPIVIVTGWDQWMHPTGMIYIGSTKDWRPVPLPPHFAM